MKKSPDQPLATKEELKQDLRRAWTELPACLADAEGYLAEIPLDLDRGQVERLLDFLTQMLIQNRTLNLSAITKPRDVINLHVLDSLSLLPLVDQETKRLEGKQKTACANGDCVPLSLLDVGTGAGFPGVPLKIARPELDIHLLDALAKRLRFINNSLNSLAFTTKTNFALQDSENITSTSSYPPVNLFHARSEELGRDAQYRESYDFVTARAVARLSALLEYCLPLVKPGGVFCAMKAKVDDELAETGKVAHILGAELEKRVDFNLPLSAGERTLLVYRKKKSCPAKYPRHNNQIKKAPLIG
ncbi:MAG: 16S rRNA (guanine(527)-N(7))-methyltransferase RsmG [Eubacteriales bacterium]|nr:16S rRNA (guanine(527)-N(7))-methyltransferase RsmG [Eubacteriales bacterium]